MFNNYFKIAWRNIIKNKLFSIINIMGLAIGLASSILIFLWVNNERSYDRFHVKADRIYRVAVRASIGDTKINQTFSSAITFIKLLEDFPEIENGVKFLRLRNITSKIDDDVYFENGLLGTDSTFFDLFDIPIISGDPKTALSQPNSVVLAESAALKYFGTLDVIGKSISMEMASQGLSDVNAKVTAVTTDVPANSHFHYSMLVSLVTFPDLINDTGWSSNNYLSYLLLKQGTSSEQLKVKLEDFTRKYMGGDEFDEWVAKGNYWEYYLQPLTDIHLNSDLNGEFEANGNKTYVSIFSVVSIITLLIACINFMNLTTAKSSLRLKEVGIRKSIGSGRISLIIQFFIESILLSYIALIASLLIVHLLLPTFSDFTGKILVIDYFKNPLTIPFLLITGLLVGLLSGSYFAFYMSSVKPIVAFKSSSSTSNEKSGIRNILVVFQFTISTIIIIGTLIVYQQLEYFQNKNLGFNKEQVLVINNPGVLTTNITSFKKVLTGNTLVNSVSGSNFLPGGRFSNIGFGAEGIENFTLNIGMCDYNYLETLQLEMAAGRYFSQDFISDSSAVILNEEAVKLLGWDEPLGKKVNNWGNNQGFFTIIGVVKDFHYESLHQKIRPMALFLEGGYYKRVQRNIALSINADNISEVISFANDKWNEFAPGIPFDYTFLDEQYGQLYDNERKTQQVLAIFAFIAILIACLGLFGLASFITNQKTKEIGIRKVFGAEVYHIVFQLMKRFFWLIIVAIIIAIPTANYFMIDWLNNFAYRIEINWWFFILPGIITLIIALGTISYHAIKAAYANPIVSIKYE